MAKRKRTLFCGGRTYSDYEAVKRVIGMVNPTSVIHGAAAGADSLAGRYAKENEVPCRAYPPSRRLDGGGRDWKFRRNERMLLTAKPDLVVAFPGGPGTDHMVRTSKKHGYPVWDLRKDDRPGELPEWVARLLAEEEEGTEAHPGGTHRQAVKPAAQPAQPAQNASAGRAGEGETPGANGQDRHRNGQPEEPANEGAGIHRHLRLGDQPLHGLFIWV